MVCTRHTTPVEAVTGYIRRTHDTGTPPCPLPHTLLSFSDHSLIMHFCCFLYFYTLSPSSRPRPQLLPVLPSPSRLAHLKPQLHGAALSLRCFTKYRSFLFTFFPAFFHSRFQPVPSLRDVYVGTSNYHEEAFVSETKNRYTPLTPSMFSCSSSFTNLENDYMMTMIMIITTIIIILLLLWLLS